MVMDVISVPRSASASRLCYNACFSLQIRWDTLGKAARLPAYVLFGGRLTDALPAFLVIAFRDILDAV